MTMKSNAIKLYGGMDRDYCHRVLEYANGHAEKLDRTDESGKDKEFSGADDHIEMGEYPKAECREDPNNPTEPFQVWSESDNP
jgi:hypothetical protein